MNLTLIREIAKMIDHSLLHPTMTDTDLREGCETGIKIRCGVGLRQNPAPFAMAAQLLTGSDRSAGAVLVGTVIGFPHGNSATSIKVAETEQPAGTGPLRSTWS